MGLPRVNYCISTKKKNVCNAIPRMRALAVLIFGIVPCIFLLFSVGNEKYERT